MNLVFDCERMRYPDTGIYHYCLNLGREVHAAAHPGSERVRFYVPRNEAAHFTAPVLVHNRLHKYCLPPLAGRTIWHSTYQHSNYLPSRARWAKVVLTIHDLNFLYDETMGDAKKDSCLRALQKRIDRADVIVCISEYCRRDLGNHCDLGDKDVRMIHNGTNALEAPALRSSSWRPRRPFLFSIGEMRHKKNFHALLPLVKRNPQLELVIAGRQDDPHYLHAMEREVHRQGVEENVHLVGRISEQEKSWYYHHCLAFLMPSVAEGFGLPVTEAMSVGKPVFISDKTALPEIGRDAAFYFRDFSGDGMQEAFTSGMSLFARRDMAQRVKTSGARFCWTKAAAEYLGIYRELARP